MLRLIYRIAAGKQASQKSFILNSLTHYPEGHGKVLETKSAPRVGEGRKVDVERRNDAEKLRISAESAIRSRNSAPYSVRER